MRSAAFLLPPLPPRVRRGGLGLLFGLLLAGCASGPPVPDWKLESHAAATRGLAAILNADERVAQAEFARARQQLARTADPARLARLELLRCAAEAASLLGSDCPAFEALRADAPPAERAYADWLQGRAQAETLALLPEAQQPVARALLSPAGASTGGAALIAGIEDPLGRLVAASVWLRAGRVDTAVIDLAIDTASAQGWRRALAAWLQAGIQVAEQRAETARAQALRRRLALLR